MNDCYETAFDAAHKLPPLWFPAVGLLFLAVGICLLFFPRMRWVQSMLNKGTRKTPEWYRKGFGVVFTGFALLWTIAATIGIVSDWWGVRHDPRHKVVGVVENFHPMPHSGHDTERFDVDGVHFEYSNYVVSSGFNDVRSHGGPIDEGKHVRIAYIEDGDDNVIVKLEIACDEYEG